MIKENVLIGHIMIDLDIYSITRNLSIEEKANYYDAIMKRYRKEKYENHLITDKVKMCFDFSCMDIEKCKAIGKQKEEQRKERASTAANARWRKAKKEAKAQAEQTDEETAPLSGEIPLADVEEVEQYPFEEFWKIYKKNVGYDKCLQVWKCQLSDEVKAKIMAHVVKYVQARPNEYFRKDPINYFKDRTYEDEVITNNPQSASNYGSNNKQSYKEAEFERNARTIVENLQAAERGELAHLSPFNPPGRQY